MADELDRETCAAGVDDGLTSEMVAERASEGRRGGVITVRVKGDCPVSALWW